MHMNVLQTHGTTEQQFAQCNNYVYNQIGENVIVVIIKYYN